MDLTTAARVFAALGSEAGLTAYLGLALAAPGLPIGELQRRCDVKFEDLSAALAILEAAGLVETQGEADAAWYTANACLLDAVLAFAAGQDADSPSGL